MMNKSLTLTEQGGLTFRLDDRHVWRSEGPFCILHYYDRQHPRAQTVPAPWDNSRAFGTAGTPSLSARSSISVVESGPGRLEVTMEFPNIHVRMGASIALRPDRQGFALTLDPESVREELPRLYRILGLEILPGFGAARTGEQGYLTLPNWFGCQTFFDREYPREVWQTIYSSNDQWEHTCNMPVFGITRAQGTLCGLVSQGDFDAQLVCRQHWEAEHANSVHPYLVYRWEQQDERLPGPRQVRYSFAPPDYAGGEGYVFCGKEYRAFLQQERGLLSWDQKEVNRPEATDYLGRFFLKIFMAYKDPHPDGTGPYHCTCTTAEAQQILESCQARGMKKITAILVGWGQDGHDGKCPTYLPVDERVGGEAGMKALIEWSRAHDVQLGVHTSHGGAYKCSAEFNVDDLIRHRTGEYWESIVWSGGQAHRVCPQVSLEKLVKRDLPALAALGFHGHHHFDAVGGFMPCYSPLHPVERRADYIALMRQEFEVALRVMGGVSTEMPFGQYFDVVDGFWHVYVHPSPWHLACPLGRYFYHRTVPLLTVALHGSVKCCQGLRQGQDYLLELLDLGISPQCEVCMRPSPAFGIPAYAKVADAMVATYQFAHGPNGFSTHLGRRTIEGRWELAPGVARTLYSDGTVVVVNRSGQPFENVSAGSYTISGKP